MIATLACGVALLAAPAGRLEIDAPAVERAAAAIHADVLRAHVRFLSDDLLEGRATGTRGHFLAAEYVETRMEALGLEPAAPGGGFEQRVPLRIVRTAEEGSFVSVSSRRSERNYPHGDEVLLSPRLRADSLSVDAEVVFVGYGVRAPGLAHDDYRGVEVRDRLVALVPGAPARFPAEDRIHHGSLKEKLNHAARAGARGVLVLQTRGARQQERWAGLVAGFGTGGLRWVEPDGSTRDPGESLDLVALMSGKASAALFQEAPISVDTAARRVQEGRHRPMRLKVRVRATTLSTSEALDSVNVVGRLPGSDPDLADEAVVFSTHLDHLGLGPGEDGDGIFNGAVDNASGVAATLEIARAFATLPRMPRRQVLFVAVTGEEVGLLGSDYFVHHPSVPIERIVADVNVDTLPMNYTPRSIVAYGAERSGLAPAVRAAASRLGMRMDRDPWPEQAFFVRSDQYSFARRGVPSVFVLPGFASADPGRDGGQLLREWFDTVYHTPHDDIDEPLDFEIAARLARLNFLIGLQLAEADPGQRVDPLAPPGRRR